MCYNTYWFANRKTRLNNFKKIFCHFKGYSEGTGARWGNLEHKFEFSTKKIRKKNTSEPCIKIRKKVFLNPWTESTSLPPCCLQFVGNFLWKSSEKYYMQWLKILKYVVLDTSPLARAANFESSYSTVSSLVA